MILNNSYHEIMDKITVTPEMRHQILSDMPEKISRRKKRQLMNKIIRYASFAACIALILTAVLTFSGIVSHDSSSSSRQDENLTQAVNGIEECASLDELMAKVNFTVTELKELPFTPEQVSYLSFWNTLAEIDYDGADNSITFRTSKEKEDNSGDYNVYETNETINVNGITITLKGNNQAYSLAIWQNEEYSYSISLEKGISKEDLTALLNANI